MEACLAALPHLFMRAPPLLDLHLIGECVAYAGLPKRHALQNADVVVDAATRGTVRMLMTALPEEIHEQMTFAAIKAVERASRAGHLDAVRYLVELPWCRFYRKEVYRLAARAAVFSCREDIARYLIESGAGSHVVNAIGKQGACTKEHARILRYALHGDVAPMGRKVLLAVAKMGDARLFKELHRRGAVVSHWCFWAAVQAGHTEIVKYLMQHGYPRHAGIPEAIAVMQRTSDAAIRWLFDNWHDSMADPIRAVVHDMDAFKRYITGPTGAIRVSKFKRLFGAACWYRTMRQSLCSPIAMAAVGARCRVCKKDVAECIPYFYNTLNRRRILDQNWMH